jgi:hypothetical protein
VDVLLDVAAEPHETFTVPPNSHSLGELVRSAPLVPEDCGDQRNEDKDASDEADAP